MNLRESIELFHLLFIGRLTAKVDRSLFCLKGGCNLRFYFQSIRYSEDIDFDAHTVSVATLRKNVEKILQDSAFATLLRHRGLELAGWSAPKQTETTQRWKIGFRMSGQSQTVPTKIEFSRREARIADSEVKFIDPLLISQYELQSTLLQHYRLESAVRQKIAALIHRTETQARDIIDLKILKDRLPPGRGPELKSTERDQALETLASVSFSDFKSQVWPYLMEAYQDHYAGRTAWDSLQNEVFHFIQTGRGPA